MNGEQMYTRNGALTRDAAGNLATVDGMTLQGWQADTAGDINTSGEIGPVQIRVGDLLQPRQTQTAVFGGNLSADAAIGSTTMRSADRKTPVATISVN